MTDAQAEHLLQLLEEIRDNQRLMVARQAESLATQKEQFAIARTQLERAERLQERSSALVATSHRFVRAVIPVVLLLLAYLAWLLFFSR